MMVVINPEEVYEVVPQLDAFSRILIVDKDERYSGLILDDLKDLTKALDVYNSGMLPSARATQDNLMESIVPNRDQMSGLMLLMMGHENSDRFMDKFLSRLIVGVSDSGYYKESFDYDAHGTNFFKTTVEAKKVQDKYLLNLHAAYVGSKPQHDLAAKLGKKEALIRADSSAVLSIVDEWWFNIDVANLLKPLDFIPPKNKKAIIDYYLNDDASRDGCVFPLEHNKTWYDVDVYFKIDSWLRPKDKDGHYTDNPYFEARDNCVVGGAWATYNEEDTGLCEPRPLNPSLVVSVSLPGDEFDKTPIVHQEEMDNMLELRNDLATQLEMSKYD